MADPLTRLHNPYPYNGGTGVEKVSGNISAEVFDYFFRHLLAGDPGARQNLVALFFEKLYSKCHDELKIPACYDPTNNSTLARLMSNLNFDGAKSSGSTRRRRPAAGSSGPVEQPPASSGE